MFNKLLKIEENLINLRSLFKKIYPSELAIIINKSYIICVFATETGAGPHISETLVPEE
jgi:hypothetical protein